MKVLDGLVVLNTALLIPIVFVPLCFIIFYSIHGNRRYTDNGVPQIATISLTGAYPPEGIIFTMGLHLEGVVAACLFTQIYLVFRRKIATMELPLPSSQADATGETMWMERCCYCTPTRQSLYFWNDICWKLGLLFSVLLAIVGSISVGVYPFVHGTFAFFMFASAVIDMFIFYLKVSRHFGSLSISRRQIVLHRIALFLAIPLNLTLAIIAYSVYRETHTDSAVHFDANIWPALEYSTVLSFFLFMESFRDELRQHRVKWDCVLLADSLSIETSVSSIGEEKLALASGSIRAGSSACEDNSQGSSCGLRTPIIAGATEI